MQYNITCGSLLGACASGRYNWELWDVYPFWCIYLFPGARYCHAISCCLCCALRGFSSVRSRAFPHSWRIISETLAKQPCVIFEIFYPPIPSSSFPHVIQTLPSFSGHFFLSFSSLLRSCQPGLGIRLQLRNEKNDR